MIKEIIRRRRRKKCPRHYYQQVNITSKEDLDKLLAKIKRRYGSSRGFKLEKVYAYTGKTEVEIMAGSQRFLSYLIGKEKKYETEKMAIVVIDQLLRYIDRIS